jgi:hypothetical protein
MAQDLIRYDLLVQDALRGVVRKVMASAASQGLPGEHHFYISFRTDAPGVRISSRLREKFPEEITIVLQHQFWDLAVTEHGFEVGLHFSGVPERLLVPFEALTGFFDPAVQFGLKFELAAVEPADNDEAGDESATALPAPAAPPAKLPATRAQKPSKEPKAEPAPAPAARERKTAKPAPSADKDPGADVVSLDAFRKKP